MMCANSADPSSVGARDLFATCPALARLTLSEAERHALARRGSVAVERRGQRCYFKLRFRAAGGRQCVRYLGSDPAVAAQVRQLLDRLQHARRQARAVKQWTRHARRLLRAVNWPPRRPCTPSVIVSTALRSAGPARPAQHTIDERRFLFHDLGGFLWTRHSKVPADRRRQRTLATHRSTHRRRRSPQPRASPTRSARPSWNVNAGCGSTSTASSRWLSPIRWRRASPSRMRCFSIARRRWARSLPGRWPTRR